MQRRTVEAWQMHRMMEQEAQRLQMMRFVLTVYKGLNREVGGQAMIETALVLPLLLGLAFNAINFGYFFLVTVNIAAAPRTGALYSILGPATPATPELPSAASVSTLTTNDLTGALYSGATTGVEVCTNNSIGGSLVSTCSQFNGSPSYATMLADPEPSNFILSQVDVTYTFTPLIDQRLFNLILMVSPICSGSGGGVTCTFHRRVAMRVMS